MQQMIFNFGFKIWMSQLGIEWRKGFFIRKNNMSKGIKMDNNYVLFQER